MVDTRRERPATGPARAGGVAVPFRERGRVPTGLRTSGPPPAIVLTRDYTAIILTLCYYYTAIILTRDAVQAPAVCVFREGRWMLASQAKTDLVSKVDTATAPPFGCLCEGVGCRAQGIFGVWDVGIRD